MKFKNFILDERGHLTEYGRGQLYLLQKIEKKKRRKWAARKRLSQQAGGGTNET